MSGVSDSLWLCHDGHNSEGSSRVWVFFSSDMDWRGRKWTGAMVESSASCCTVHAAGCLWVLDWVSLRIKVWSRSLPNTRGWG